jgi:imidazolonepropionase-like amidohydrolase
MNAKDFKLIVDLGMPPIEALRAATSADADLLGISAQVGT